MSLTVKWETTDTLLIARVGQLEHKQSAAFDYDDTLIRRSDRTWMPGMREKITRVSKTYNVIIVSNQKKSYIKDETLKSKFEVFVTDIQIPLLAFFARGDDTFRKPSIGTISLMPHKPEYYVGDAAGRIQDHSDCDIKFAQNASIPFYTPEQFVCPTETKEVKGFELPKTPTIIVLTGYPASGKSTWAAEQKISIASRDHLKTMDKCCQFAAQEIKAGRSVIIDNLNPDVKSRSQFLQLAKAAGVPCVSILVESSIDNAIKNNDTRAAKVPKIVLYGFRKKFQAPSATEGFDALYTIPGYIKK